MTNNCIIVTMSKITLYGKYPSRHKCFLCKSLLTTTEYKDTVPLASLQDSAIHNLFPIIYINLNFNIHQLCLYIPSTIL